MTRVLALDTAGPVVGVSFGDDVRWERVTRGAEARLLPWALELTGGLHNIDAIAVAVGPGAFTGVRVGLAHAQGLAHALDVPLIGVNSLESRAKRANAVLSLLDARKARVYAGWQMEQFTPVDWELDAVLDHGLEQGWIVPGFLCTGEGALVYRGRIEKRGGRVADAADHPAMDALAAIAIERLENGETGREPVLPVYVRPPDAVPPRRGV